MKLKTYPEYKDSGLPWLGNIPEHWSCLPNRAIFREIKDQGHVNEPLLSVTIGRGIIRQADLLADSSKRDSSNPDKSKYKLVTPGDIAYNKMRAWQGAIGVSRHRGIVSPAYIVVRTYLSHNPNYFHFLLRTPGFTTEAERWSYGITSDQWSLRPEHFKMIYCCVPSRGEQDLIVRFLRQLDRQIDRFIRNKQRLIELLQEQKQVIINRTVTRGIDPDVHFKPSGIDWLGDVPEHWEVKRLRYVLCGNLTNGLFKKKDQYGSGVPLINIFDIYRDDFRVRTDQLDHVEVSDSEKRTYAVEPGDIFFVRSSLKMEGTGRSAFVADRFGPVVFECHLVQARPDGTQVHPRFLATYLNTNLIVNYLISRANTVTMSTVPQGVLKSIPVALPPISEQHQILSKIDHELDPILKAKQRTQRQIDLIREYRTRLIADVVTGKVDVRGIPVEDVPEDEASEELAESREMEEAPDIGEIQDAKQ